MGKRLIKFTVFVIWAAIAIFIYLGLRNLYEWYIWEWSAGEIAIIMMILGLAVITAVYLIMDRKVDATWFAAVFIATVFLSPVFQKIYLDHTWLPFFFILPAVFVSIGMVIHGHRNFWAPLKKSVRWAAIITWAMFLGYYLSSILLNDIGPFGKLTFIFGIAMGSCVTTVVLTAIASLIVLLIKKFIWLNLRAFKQERLELEVAEEDTDKDFATSPI